MRSVHLKKKKYVSLSVGVYAACVQCPWKAEEGVRSLAAGGLGCCALPDTDAKNWMQVP